MEENYEKNIVCKFLKNKPLGEDLFENKSQDKIAEVISDKIINDPEFKIIGIDGEWGSGKSNLVSLLEKKLESSHKFFIYDVWGHQEDEQRKSILVELTDYIRSEADLLKKGNKKVWENNLKKILAKSKETTTINQPYLSVGFIFSLFSIVYVPTVNVFKESIKDFFEIESWFWKLVLVAFPIFIVLGIYLWNYCKNLIDGKAFLSSFRFSAEETFQVYTNKQKEETKIETISEDQPSVRDFQNWMEDINNDLEKKLVIVFDNFDRLPKKHIQNIWSSIHIFFAEKGYSNIKVIIPFDREHVQNAFKELNGLDSKFGDDYVNKTFDIIFRITLPIMSNWKKFFSEQWKKAFVNCDEDELKLVIQVYEFLNRRITPREIISFINEILTIKLLDNSFKERYIAIFVLKKDEILKDPLKAITNLGYLKGLNSFYRNDLDFSKQLTAIIYHIDVENALELIYTQELKDSLNKNDVDQFNTICQSEFIDSIFNSAINELDIFENPIKTLSKLDENSKLSNLHINQAWKLFYDKVVENYINVEKIDIEDWQMLLFKNISDDLYLSSVLKNFVKIVNLENVLIYINLISRFKDELGIDRVNNLLIEKSVDAETFLKLTENEVEDYSDFKIKMNEEELDDYLSEMNIQTILELSNTKVLVQNFTLDKYIGVLKGNFKAFSSNNNIKEANDILIKIKESSSLNGDLKDLLNNDQIDFLYHNSINSELPIINDLIAMRISLGSKFRSSYGNSITTSLNDENEEKSEILAVTILHYIDYGSLLLKSKYFEDRPLFRQMILNMFTKNDLVKRLKILDSVQNYNELKTSLRIQNSELLKELNQWKISSQDLNIDKLDDNFINDCFDNSDLKISVNFLEAFNQKFKNFDNDAYKQVFNDSNNLYFKYFERLNGNSLTQASLDIFEKHFLEKLKVGIIEDTWWNVLKTYDLNNAILSTTNSFKNIRDQYLNSNIILELHIAKVILPYFIKYDLLIGKLDVFRLILKNEFLSDDSFVDLLITNASSIKDLYKNASQTEKNGFRNTINEKRESIDLIERLASLIDIRKKSKE